MTDDLEKGSDALSGNLPTGNPFTGEPKVPVEEKSDFGAGKDALSGPKEPNPIKPSE